MTSIDTWSPWVAIIVTGGLILLGVVSIAYTLYLSHHHMDAIKEALKNSRYFIIWGPSLGKRGLTRSLLEIPKIAGMVTLTRAHIQIGDINPVDLENFPPYLKRLLIADIKIKALGLT